MSATAWENKPAEALRTIFAEAIPYRRRNGRYVGRKAIQGEILHDALKALQNHTTADIVTVEERQLLLSFYANEVGSA